VAPPPRLRCRPPGCPADIRLCDARRNAARLDLPAERPLLGRQRRPGRWHGRCLGRVRIEGDGRAGQAARPVARSRPARAGYAGPAVPAWCPLERGGFGRTDAPHAGDGLRRAGHRLPRIRPQQPRPALGGDGLRGCARGLGLAGEAAPPAATLCVRPFARRRRRNRPRLQGRGREGHHRRRHLHLDPGRGQHLQVGLAPGRPADHPALLLHRQGGPYRLAPAGGAWRQRQPDQDRARAAPVRRRQGQEALRAGRGRLAPQHDVGGPGPLPRSDRTAVQPAL
ncbi:MAG: hypothetical protein AVDCRST_MAG51-697, partial [uncultured Ramlibacter sp.]